MSVAPMKESGPRTTPLLRGSDTSKSTPSELADPRVSAYNSGSGTPVALDVVVGFSTSTSTPLPIEDAVAYIATISERLRTSFYLSDNSFVELPLGLDVFPLLVSAYVRLDCDTSITTMRTILTNKRPGCYPTNRGISLYVNEWGTSDGLMYIEYGNAISGCLKLSTGHSIGCDAWHHVALYSSQQEMAVFVDGRQVAVHALQDMEKGNRDLQTEAPFVFGCVRIQSPWSI
jgi:hypothetical protein